MRLRGKIVSLVMCSLLLTSCSNGTESIDKNKNSDSFKENQICWSQSSPVTSCDTGYYMGKNEDIYYLDKESMEAISLADTNGESFSSEDQTVRYSQGMLYYVSNNGDGTVLSLYQADADGANVKKLVDIVNVVSGSYCVTMELHNGYAYIAVDLQDGKSELLSDFSLYRVKLEQNAEVEKIYSISDTTDIKFHTIDRLYGIDNMIYFMDYTEKEDQTYTINLLSYNTETQEISTVLSDVVKEYYTIVNNEVYYYVLEDNKYSLVKYNLDTAKTEVVIEDIDSDQIGTLSYDGQYLYSSTYTESVSSDDENYYLWIYSLDGKNIDKINLTQNNVFLVYFGDEDYLFFEDNNSSFLIYDKSQIGTGNAEFLTLSLG